MPRPPRPAGPRQPIGEVFGYPISNTSPGAQRAMDHKLCPYNNIVPACTKDDVDDPLGVCSVLTPRGPVITCPVRFRQDWTIERDAAAFFFSPGTRYERLSEVRLKDASGNSAGNIDHVLVTYDARGRVTNFGSLEVQAVYISGNMRLPFEHFVRTRDRTMNWPGQRNYPNPDYLSSSRKRLAPQILYKGSILKQWGQKQAVALQRSFYRTLPPLPAVDSSLADMAWLIYDLVYDASRHVYDLTLVETIYSTFDDALREISIPQVGKIEPFLATLQTKLDAKRAGHDMFALADTETSEVGDV
jgi:Restriction endonuclease NotI